MDFVLVVAIVVGFIAGYATCGVLTAMNFWVDSYAKPPVARGMRPTEPSPCIDGPIADPSKQSRGAVYQPAPVPRILYANDNPKNRAEVEVCLDASAANRVVVAEAIRRFVDALTNEGIVVSARMYWNTDDPTKPPTPHAPPPAPQNQTTTKGG